MGTQRKYYIDNLRILLTSLVIIHHLAIAYGAPGLWYYNEPNSHLLSTTLLTLLVAVNQSFFMGMFFMISAYFLYRSASRKSTPQLFHDKLLRLGLPLLFYVVIISPFLIGWCNAIDKDSYSISSFFFNYYSINTGPLWFVAALLLFTTIALLFRESWHTSINITPIPSFSQQIIFAVSLGFISFGARILFPVGYSLPILGFQPGHFPQYLALFYMGILIAKHDWLAQIQDVNIKGWLWLILIFIFLLFPIVFLINTILSGDETHFMGGFTWQSFIYSLWEQIVGIGLIILLGVFFKKKFNYQNSFTRQLSANTYAVYIIHALILVACSILFRSTVLSAGIKFLVLTPICLVLSFGLANLLRQVTFLKKIL